jgi:multidrug efflux pump subunit AcrB
MPIDIFPKMGAPTVYVAQPYGGLSPDQMEGFVTSYYEYHFLYITGVKYVDSKSIQGAALIKIEFREGTDMSQAMAEVVGYVNRARAFMPPGTVPPFITRFDAGSVPVGQLVFSSPTRSLSEISDLALFRVRPMFSTLPGVSAPPPFGANQKTVIIHIQPDKIRNYQYSPDDIVNALMKTNVIAAAGNMRMGDSTYITPQNGVIDQLSDLENTPLTNHNGTTVYLKDIATVSMSADITSSYALVNGKRSVYIPVTKRADASTWSVVQQVKAALPDMQAAIPPDIHVSYEFDQSAYVIKSLKNLLAESGLGALLTGLMVLLFLGDARSAGMVVLTIPLALLCSAALLYLFGQTINIMTLGGLALSVGILVDEATVTVENIHRHLEMHTPIKKAIANAAGEIALPKLFILLSILAVFVPSLFMQGIPRAMFLPLSLAVGFSMIASFLLSQSLIPVLSNWWLKGHSAFSPQPGKQSLFSKWKSNYLERLRRNATAKKRFSVWILPIIACTAAFILFRLTGTELFPKPDSGMTQIRLRLPTGTRLERTESATLHLLKIAETVAGKDNVLISSAFVGTQPTSFPVNYIHLWTSGPHESVLKIQLKQGQVSEEFFEEQVRATVKKEMPDAHISFEPGDLSEQVLNMGTTNPVEIAILNRNIEQGYKTAETLMKHLSAIPSLRDLQIATPLHYPAIKLNIDRVKAGQLGMNVDEITRSLTTATSSSRFFAPSYWLDKSTGTAYMVQVQYPEYQMNETEKLEELPVGSHNNQLHTLGEVASWQATSIPGEYDRLNQQRYITVTANIAGNNIGKVFKELQKVIESIPLPKGSKISMRGQPELMQSTFTSLAHGLGIALVIIFLLLTVFFQSFRLPVITLLLMPVVLTGSLLLLYLTGNTLNIQSYMGMIMAIGVSMANTVLYLTRAEQTRKETGPLLAHITAAESRIRPIVMTSLAMIAGMLPMAVGLGENGKQMASLGIAVIGGLLLSTFSTFYLLPGIYQFVMGTRTYRSVSLDPEDQNA